MRPPLNVEGEFHWNESDQTWERVVLQDDLMDDSAAWFPESNAVLLGSTEMQIRI
jgi:hypothetical protein